MQLSHLLKSRDLKYFVLDILMMAILVINLALILFDWIFVSESVQNLLRQYSPDFFYYYHANIHRDFLRIDLYFVSIFVVELIIRWIIAIKNGTYHRWFFYPFVHWYDVLGCIPVGTFRFLRILRVVSIIIRLQKLKVIDLTQTYLYGKFTKYTNIIVEEISDRVVVNILEDVQDEINRGGPITDRVLSEVIMPQKETLVEWISHRVQRVSTEAHEAYKEDIRQYVNKRITEAVEQNKEIAVIEQVPVLGRVISNHLEKAISDIVYNVISGAFEDLASQNNKSLVQDLTDLTLDSLQIESDDTINLVAKDMVLQALELVKGQVKVQQWKIRDMEEREAKMKAKMEEAFEEE